MTDYSSAVDSSLTVTLFLLLLLLVCEDINYIECIRKWSKQAERRQNSY